MEAEPTNLILLLEIGRRDILLTFKSLFFTAAAPNSSRSSACVSDWSSTLLVSLSSEMFSLSSLSLFIAELSPNLHKSISFNCDLNSRDRCLSVKFQVFTCEDEVRKSYLSLRCEIVCRSSSAQMALEVFTLPLPQPPLTPSGPIKLNLIIYVFLSYMYKVEVYKLYICTEFIFFVHNVHVRQLLLTWQFSLLFVVLVNQHI